MSELLFSTASFDHTSMDDFYGNSVQGIGLQLAHINLGQAVSSAVLERNGTMLSRNARPACAMEILMVMAT